MLCLLSTFAAPTHPQQQCLFSGASLRNHSGTRVECSRFAGRQVALYFAGEWCPLCRYVAAESNPAVVVTARLVTSVEAANEIGASRSMRCTHATSGVRRNPANSYGAPR